MQLSALTAISPVDGRYRNQLQHLDKYFSEFALIKCRVYVEIAYFFFLNENNFFTITPYTKQYLQNAYDDFSLADAEKIKDIEKVTNHDVKAIEYFLKDLLDKSGEGQKKRMDTLWFNLTGY